MSEQQAVSKYPELITALTNCARDNYTCAIRAQEEGIDCWKDCSACSEICEATAKCVTLGNVSMPYTQRLIDAAMGACRQCAEECQKHQNQHCKKCSESSSRCMESIKGFKSKQSNWQESYESFE